MRWSWLHLLDLVDTWLAGLFSYSACFEVGTVLVEEVAVRMPLVSLRIMGIRLFNVGIPLLMLALDRIDCVPVGECLAEIRLGVCSVVPAMEDLAEALDRGTVSWMCVVGLGRTLQEFLASPAWLGLPRSRFAVVLRCDTAVAVTAVEGALVALFEDNCCELQPLFLRCTGFIDSGYM